MSTSEYICYLKDGEIYHILAGNKTTITLNNLLKIKEKITLLIDDSYFFYIGMEKVNVSERKLKAIASNFLNIKFPSDMIKSFNIYKANDASIIYILSEELINIINNHQELFNNIKKITTPFIELASKYQNFTFSDGDKIYKKDGSSITQLTDKNEEYTTIEEFLSDITITKSNIVLPGIKRKTIFNSSYIVAGMILTACYIMFVIGCILKINSAAKIDKEYQMYLEEVYKSVNITETADPYGMLLFKAKKGNTEYSSRNVLTILKNLSDEIDLSITLISLSIRDKNIRIEGKAENFAKIEEVEKKLEEKLKVEILMDEAKKNKDGITFVMKYEQ